MAVAYRQVRILPGARINPSGRTAALTWSARSVRAVMGHDQPQRPHEPADRRAGM